MVNAATDGAHASPDALYLGIELGSTRIKACAVSATGTVRATGAYSWDSTLVDGHWSYSLDEVWAGIRAAYRRLDQALELAYGIGERRFAGIGISAMMHGYLAFDAAGKLLVPFRTWRDTYASQAADLLTERFGVNVPLRWSVSHLYQAILDQEPHVQRVAFLTTLAGYVHWKLTGERVLGVGDAVGMFPIDPATKAYDTAMAAAFDEAVDAAGLTLPPITRILPRPLVAGTQAGVLSTRGASLIDPTGRLCSGTPMCPPEGDAGTGMVATNAVAPKTGNVSVGTSIFAMLVLDRPMTEVHREIDPVATPAGDPVAMVHCNNGTNELSAWMAMFAEVGRAFGKSKIHDMDDVYRVLLTEALAGEPDAGGLVAFNYLSGEPVTDVAEGRPLMVRGPRAQLTVSNFLRAQIYAAFASLELGMRILRRQGARFDALFAHGGLFRTPKVGQKLLAAAMNTPVALAPSAAEGGAWGMALLARYADVCAQATQPDTLGQFLERQIFAGRNTQVVDPDPADVAGFNRFLERFTAALPVARAAGKDVY